MVSRAEKNRMTEFLAGRLEESGKYQIREADHSHVLVAERPEIVENPQTIDVIALNSKIPVKELKRMQEENREAGIYTSHLTYNDGENFMVRLGERGWKKNNKSLKNYTVRQVMAMVHLRGLEKEVLSKGQQVLATYQPKTSRLPESIRVFRMAPVVLDYSHIPERERYPGFQLAKDSDDYRLPGKLEEITDGVVNLELGETGMRFAYVREGEQFFEEEGLVTRLEGEQHTLF